MSGGSSGDVLWKGKKLKGVEMARVAVVGVGAIGGALAGFLETAGGHELILCTRRPMPELTVRVPDGTVRVKASNLTAPAQAQAVDWVLVATKAYDAEGAAQWFPRLCAEGAPVAVIQNGVEHRRRFAPYLSAEHLLPVVIDCPVERSPEGVVSVRGPARMKVEDCPLGRDFAALFQGSNAAVDRVDDFTTAAWWKLSVNSVGALNALALRPSGVLRSEALSHVARAMVAESVAVARAEGAQLSDSLPEEVLAHYRNHPPDSVNSLLADRLAGRRTEWDARNGAIVRFGEKHGIPTPLNRMAAALLQAVEESL
jgi:2-dehydropantoate 2-reductase